MLHYSSVEHAILTLTSADNLVKYSMQAGVPQGVLTWSFTIYQAYEGVTPLGAVLMKFVIFYKYMIILFLAPHILLLITL